MSNKTKPFTQITHAELAGMRGLGASSILVYMALRIYGGKDSRAWPSQDRIAEDLRMPIGSVRRALGQLRERKAIVKTDAKTKSPTYRIRDLSIADMRSQKESDDLTSEIPTSQIRDPSIADMRSDDLGSEIQIYKEYIKENIHLIKNDSENRSVDLVDAKKGESIDSPVMGQNDLLFVELWNKHSLNFGMRSTGGNPLSDWPKIKEGFGVYQIERGLKTLDIKMSASTHPWPSYQDRRWVLKIRQWIGREPNTPPTSRERSYLSTAINIGPDRLEEHHKEAREAKEAAEKAQAVAMQPTSAARGLWREFRLNNEEWSALVAAVQKWQRTFLTEKIRQEIEQDPLLEDFALIINL